MIESAKYELKLALTFAKISSTAYQGGNLKHAADARSKAEAVRQRAIADLAAASIVDEQGVQSMLGELQTALASLPSQFDVNFRVRRAG
jgi:hypothetical protein